MSITCERCGRDEIEGQEKTVELDDEHELCEPCYNYLIETIEQYDWRDRYTEEHHQRAMDLLSEQDEIQCVIGSYEHGQIIVHTPYVSSDAIADVAEHFKLEIRAFHPIWMEEHDSWQCVDRHGSTFQVLLEYNHHRPVPIPNNVKFTPGYNESLEPSDKQF